MIINSSAITDMKNIMTQELLDHSMNSSMQFYIAAVINASQYRNGHRIRYVLGASDFTTDADNNTFCRGYSFFYCVFSASNTSEIHYLLPHTSYDYL